MQIQITGRNVEITQALKDFINKKMSRLERHSDHINQMHIILKVEKDQQIAEATVHITGTELFAQSSDENMYASIDVLLDKLDRQIIKHKEKNLGH
jgi:putative sigma-54 modulation protein